MGKIRLYCFATACMILLLSLNSCKGPAEVYKVPEVVLKEGEAFPNSLTFAIEPVDALKCAWLCVPEGSEIPSADRILSTGTEADASKESVGRASELEPATTYVIVAAVSGKGGVSVSEKLVMTTLEAAQETETVEFALDKAVRMLEDNEPGEYRIRLTDADGEYDLLLDMFAAADSETLPAAAYTLADDTQPGTLWKNGSSLKMKGEPSEITFAAGSVKVSVLAGVYTLEANLTGDDGRTFKGSFVGKVENMETGKPVGPYEINFTEVECDNEYAEPGEFYMIMKDADGSHELILDLFAAEDVVALPSGTYSWGAGTEPMTVNGEYTFLKIKLNDVGSSTTVMFSDGMVVVSISDGVYTLDIELVAEEDGSVYKGRFEGKIVGMPVEPSEIVEFTVDEAKLHDNSDPATGRFYVKLNDKDSNYEMALDFYAAPGSPNLPAGKYTVGENNVEGSLGTSSYLDIFSPYSTNYFQSGSVTVAKVGDVYTFDMELLGRDDNRLFKGSFEGEIAGMEAEPVGEVYEFVATNAALHFNSDPAKGNFYVNLGDEEYTFYMSLDFWAAPGSVNLPAGTYTVGDEKVEGALGKSSYLDVYNPYSTSYFRSGSVTVSKEGDVYTFDVSLVSRDNNDIFNVSFTGTIKDMPTEPAVEAYEFVMTQASFHSNTDPSTGRFYVKLNDDSWAHEMALDFYAAPGSQSLPAGTYTVGKNNVENSLGTSSYLDIHKPYSTNYFGDGSVTVSKAGDVYTFEMELTGRDDGRLFKGRFTGAVASAN